MHTCRGKQTLKVREHKTLGPYVENLSKLAVRSFKVSLTKGIDDELFLSLPMPCLALALSIGHQQSNVRGEQVKDGCGYSDERRKLSVPCSVQHRPHPDHIRPHQPGERREETVVYRFSQVFTSYHASLPVRCRGREGS